MSLLAARRRHPAAIFVVLLLALVFTGGAYAAFAPNNADAAPTATANDVQEGKKLFLANCATCHGVNATGSGSGSNAGPSLVGVGAAAVDFQVGTGRMPMVQPGVQVSRNKVTISAADTKKLSAYIASLGPGPSIPDANTVAPDGNVARGGEIFRVNCAMCHNFVGAGGALTRGKFAPPLGGVSDRHIYEAMLTGPQSMPVFNDTNLSPADKKDVITYLNYVDGEANSGGHNLGNLGPVSEGMFAWTIGIGLLIGAAVWLGRKAA